MQLFCGASSGSQLIARGRMPRLLSQHLLLPLAKSATCRLGPRMKTRPSPVHPANVDAASSRVRVSSPVDFHYFDPDEPIENLSGNLPHWRQSGVTYFVTFRLADSLPEEKLRSWALERDAWIKAHPEPHTAELRREFYELFPARLQRWLDQGHGSCVLAIPGIKRIVENALHYFEGLRYRLDEFVVMPNHVHVLVTPAKEQTLSRILHSWKSFTASKINSRLQTSGTLWRKESFDHIVRSPEGLVLIREYIRNNPRKK